MCRFLISKSKKASSPKSVLADFADMAEKSKAYDGDWQGDGWGVCWWNGNSWEHYVSLKPIWIDRDFFSYIPETKFLCIHARSASFSHHKNTIEFNQPFIHGRYAFVFNGLIKGVTLPYHLEGRIGSQKIWSLVQKYLQKYPPDKSLELTALDLNKYSRDIQALNMGLSDGKNIYVYSQFSKHDEYYNLHLSDDLNKTMVVSEKLKNTTSKKIAQMKVFKW